VTSTCAIEPTFSLWQTGRFACLIVACLVAGTSSAQPASSSQPAASAPSAPAAAASAAALAAAAAGSNASSGVPAAKSGDTKSTEQKVAPSKVAAIMSLKIEPESVDFQSQSVGTSWVEPLVVKNEGESAVTLTDISTGGDFSVSSNKCELGPGGSCPLFITFKPAKVGTAHSSVVVTLGGTTRVIANLKGVATARCDKDARLACHGVASLGPVIAMVALYALGLLVVRWNLIAVPSRRLLQAEIDAVMARVQNLRTLDGSRDHGLDRIVGLLELARAQAPIEAFWGVPFEVLLWCRGQETAGWSLMHEAEEQLVHFLPVADLRAALERSETELRQVAGPVSMSVAESIRTLLTQCPVTCDATARAVLEEAQTFLAQVAGWQGDFATLGAASAAPAIATDPAKSDQLATAQGISGALAASSLSLKTVIASFGVAPASASAELQILIAHIRDIIVPQAGQLAAQIDAAIQSGSVTKGGLFALFAGASTNLGMPAAQTSARVTAALAERPSHATARWRALYAEAMNIVYSRRDTDLATLLSWHNKTTWLTGCGLLLVLALAAALENDVLFLLGATGGLLSRLSRSLYRQDVPTDYGASWTTLFLSPVVGAIAGWAGVLLVHLCLTLGVLGTMFASISWDNSFNTLSFALALVFGFSERAFDTVLSGLENKVVVGQSTAAAPAAARATISTATLKDARVGQPYADTLSVTGGTGKFTFVVSGGALPVGIELSKDGQFSGSPAKDGPTHFTVHAADSAGTPTAPKDLTILVLP